MQQGIYDHKPLYIIPQKQQKHLSVVFLYPLKKHKTLLAVLLSFIFANNLVNHKCVNLKDGALHANSRSTYCISV